MCRLTNCCCCLDLRTGTIFISILLFISTLAKIPLKTTHPDLNSGAGLAFFIIFIIAAIGFWIVLFIGALMRNTTMLGISMIALIAYIIINIILVIYITVMYLVVRGCLFNNCTIVVSNSGEIAIIVLAIILTLALIGLDVYFALVIQSFRLEIIVGGSGSGLPYQN